MFGDQRRVFVSRCRVTCFDRGRQPPVQLGAIRLELRLVGHRADQRMVERILRFAGEPDLIDELGLHQARRRPVRSPSTVSRSRPNRDPMTAAALNVRFAFGSKPIDACGDGRLQRGRHTDLSTLCGRHVCAALPAQHATLGQFAHDLLGEKRITGGPLGDRLAQSDNRGVRPEQLTNQCCSLRITQRRKGYGLCTVHPRQRSLVLGAVGDQHQRGCLRDHREEIGQHRLADLIDPMGVLNDIDRRGLAGQRGGIHQRGQPPPTRIRINPRKRHIRVGDAQQVIEQHQILGVCVGNLGAHSIAGGLLVKTLDAGGRAQQPRHGMEGDLAGVRLAEGGEHLHTTGARHRRHLAHQTALADARWPHHTDHRAVAVDCAVQQALNGGHLPPPTDQIRLEHARQRDAVPPCPTAAGPRRADRHP